MNTETLNVIGKYATPEVLTVMTGVAAAWIGWKVAAKSFGLLGAIAQRASFLGLTAAVLFITGLGTTGVGTGEVVARVSNGGGDTPKVEKVGMSDENLAKLIDKCHDKEMVKLVLDYSRTRDGISSGEETQILAKLVEKQMADRSNFDKDGTNTALVAFVEYLRAKEQNKTGVAPAPAKTVKVSTATAGTGELIDEAKALIGDQPVVAENPNSRMSLPTSLGMIGIGIAASIAGIVAWNRRIKVA
jgi:hypothetical protein